ncbi:Rv2231c family pyridoxal phosphate-dependent protein CobC [Rhodococcus sp. G-MC3]|uniref:Rv2231c family pyridoxal phosphate-dependent protein CobC n=1 Tax=Rhodococcus sp. G-MC3 TaxID=3046209 RepID=UPI0024B91112|nr:Rv2231c family pyridoxal phosphate-dependent protein CobC [Rhodococcus sp. G-MC3]MDJ0393003.1 Rv2231c family pyridoxal phosphate-dependent protein CobC [Rhodococcus sp. G-MC3]
MSFEHTATLIGDERNGKKLDALSLLRHHGDAETGDGLIDFAVNVQGSSPPRWLQKRLAAKLTDLGAYPTTAADRLARETIARRHGRDPEEVLLLSGGAEGFAMLPRLRPALAAVINPSFTEPELALREADVAVHQVMLSAPYLLDPSRVPEAADMVVIGNPTNPTSVLHDRADILALRRPGRILVVDEAFMDAVPAEEHSVAGDRFDDVLVLRSLTKTWALAGLRCGYALGDPDVLARLTHGRAHWPVGTLQIEAITACSEPAAVEISRNAAASIAVDRDAMITRLREAGIDVHTPARAPFLLVKIPSADTVRRQLRADGIAVRRCDTFPGLPPGHIRVAVRGPEQVDVLLTALTRALESHRGSRRTS